MGALLRGIVYMLAVAVGLSIIRNFIGIIAKWMFGSDKDKKPDERSQVLAGGTLRKCAGCGTYTPETTSIRSGDTWYCSKDCLKRLR